MLLSVSCPPHHHTCAYVYSHPRPTRADQPVSFLYTTLHYYQSALTGHTHWKRSIIGAVIGEWWYAGAMKLKRKIYHVSCWNVMLNVFVCVCVRVYVCVCVCVCVCRCPEGASPHHLVTVLYVGVVLVLTMLWAGAVGTSLLTSVSSSPSTVQSTGPHPSPITPN